MTGRNRCKTSCDDREEQMQKEFESQKRLAKNKVAKAALKLLARQRRRGSGAPLSRDDRGCLVAWQARSSQSAQWVTRPPRATTQRSQPLREKPKKQFSSFTGLESQTLLACQFSISLELESSTRTPSPAMPILHDCSNVDSIRASRVGGPERGVRPT
jgi:hypothetical protein